MDEDFIYHDSFGQSQLSLEFSDSESSESSSSDSINKELKYEIPKSFESQKDLDLEENYQEFENVEIMTLTLIANLNNEISNLENLFFVLPWIKTEYPKQKRKIEKFKIPWPGVPGVICSIGYKNMKRGIVTSTSDAWPHSVCLHISNSSKMVACKISRNTIHMTGCKNIEMGKETSELLIEIINNSYMGIKSMKKLSSDKINEIFLDILRKGSFFKKDKEISAFRHRFDVRRIDKIPDYLTQDEKNFYNLCYAAVSDLKKFTHVRRKLKWVKYMDNFSSKSFKSLELEQGLIKLNFKLGFNIDLEALNVLFRVVDTSFLVDYQPMVRSYVKIEREREIKTKNRKKKDSIEKHSFNIRQKGQVQFSSKNFTEMKEVYNRFIWVIDQIRKVIIVEST